MALSPATSFSLFVCAVVSVRARARAWVILAGPMRRGRECTRPDPRHLEEGAIAIVEAVAAARRARGDPREIDTRAAGARLPRCRRGPRGAVCCSTLAAG